MKRLYIILVLVATLLYAIPICAQKPLTKPEKPTQTAPTTKASSGITSKSNCKPARGYINGHEYVDLGLSVKWATCNVGASIPSDFGDYYAWGETKTKPSYLEDNCVTFDKGLGSICGNKQYDVASANWGSTWRLPTKNEMEELVNKCTWGWTTQGGHKGCKVIGPNGNSLFLPAADSRSGTTLYDVWTYGRYWSGTPDERRNECACSLFFFDNDLFGVDEASRGFGYSIRPVSE